MENTHWLRYCFGKLAERGLVHGEFSFDYSGGKMADADFERTPLIRAVDLFPRGIVPEDKLEVSRRFRSFLDENEVVDTREARYNLVAKTKKGSLDLCSGIGVVKRPRAKGSRSFNYFILEHNYQSATYSGLDLHLDLGEDCVSLDESINFADRARSRKVALLQSIIGKTLQEFNKQSPHFGINLMTPQEAIDNFLGVLFSLREQHFSSEPNAG